MHRFLYKSWYITVLILRKTDYYYISKYPNHMIDKIFISCYQVSKYHNVISRLGESIVKFQVLICQIIMREKVYKSINRISYQNHSVTKIIQISPISTSFKISHEGRYPIRMSKQFPIINNINIPFT